MINCEIVRPFDHFYIDTPFMVLEVRNLHGAPYITANIRGLVARKKLQQDKANKALSIVKGVLDYSEFKDVDMVIEVWTEPIFCQVMFRRMVSSFPSLLLCFASLLSWCYKNGDDQNFSILNMLKLL